jgi:hypothetical protein
MHNLKTSEAVPHRDRDRVENGNPEFLGKQVDSTGACEVGAEDKPNSYAPGWCLSTRRFSTESEANPKIGLPRPSIRLS